MANEKRLIDANVVLAKQFTSGLSDASGNYYGHADVIFADDIANAPTVDAVEVVHGRWESTRFGDIRIATCSACGAKQGLYINGRVPNLNYCPNCGAKMGDKLHYAID